MAWEEFRRGFVQGYTGDIPLIEMRSAIKRICREYIERFGRKPYFVELLYAIQATVEADLSAYVSDSKLPSLEALVTSIGAEVNPPHLDPADYEGALDSESDDFLVFPRKKVGRAEGDNAAILRGQVINLDATHLLCRITILAAGIRQSDAQVIVRQCVLAELLDVDMNEDSINIQFEADPG